VDVRGAGQETTGRKCAGGEKSSAPALPHSLAMKNRGHDFQSRAVAERNRRLVFLQRSLAMKTQIFDFRLRGHDERKQAAAIKKRWPAI
jgi:hypothetical protein